VSGNKALEGIRIRTGVAGYILNERGANISITKPHTYVTSEDSLFHFDRQQFHRIHDKHNALRSVTEIFHDVNCRLSVLPARLDFFNKVVKVYFKLIYMTTKQNFIG
jgi:hypothetical protein